MFHFMKKNDEAMNACCSLRLSSPLRKEQLKHLADQTQLDPKEIDEFHQDFLHSYPRGYLSLPKFLLFYQTSKQRPLTSNEKIHLKDIFHSFDLNSDNKLDFAEFLVAIAQLNSPSVEEKLLFIAQLHSKEKKEKRFSSDELKLFFEEIFHLLDLPLFQSQFQQFIQQIFSQLKSKSSIEWKEVREILLAQRSSLPSILQPAPQRRSSSSSSSSTVRSIVHLSACF